MTYSSKPDFTLSVLGFDYGLVNSGLVRTYWRYTRGTLQGWVSIWKAPPLGSLKDYRRRNYDYLYAKIGTLNTSLKHISHDLLVIDADLMEVYWGKRLDAVIKAFFLGMAYHTYGEEGVMVVPPRDVRGFVNMAPSAKKVEVQERALAIITPYLATPDKVKEMSSHEKDALILTFIGLVKTRFEEAIDDTGVFNRDTFNQILS